ncbi:UNVERIFIED_CONTAM: hypothetical protein Sradi_7145300 [Sesamum radiatum]|uniref:Integrase catalytic domain-containing protein n=1 Tax=Sesamum radiatum TaxID=300843 RepID=A0AAW2IXH5_SESRA
MRYKSEAFGRFKEYNLKPRIKLAVIKKLRSDWGGEYLSGEFIVYLKENGILSQWTPRGTLQLNGMAERRKSNPIAHGSIRDKFYRITPSFWGHALETAAKLLHKVPSKTVPQKPYEIADAMKCYFKKKVGCLSKMMEHHLNLWFSMVVFLSSVYKLKLGADREVIALDYHLGAFFFFLLFYYIKENQEFLLPMWCGQD